MSSGAIAAVCCGRDEPILFLRLEHGFTIRDVFARNRLANRKSSQRHLSFSGASVRALEAPFFASKVSCLRRSTS